MSTNLAQVLESIKSEIKVNADGIGYVSIRGAARLAGVNNMSLNRVFLADDFSTSKLAQTLINKGFDVKTFSSQGIPDKALACILEYYTFDAGKRCTEIAELSYRTFATIGIRYWLHRSVGYVGSLQPCLEQEQPQLEPTKDINQLVKEQKKTVVSLLEEQKLEKIFTDLIRYCKGEPRTTGYFGSHSLMRRQAVLDLFGKKGQRYLNKPQIIKVFRSAEAAGYGTLSVNGKQIYTFTPSTNLKLLTA